MQGRNATHVVDKMLRNAYNMAYIRMTLPGACLIHAVRHPLDVALSCFAQPFEGRGLPWASQLDGALAPCHQYPMVVMFMVVMYHHAHAYRSAVVAKIPM